MTWDSQIARNGEPRRPAEPIDRLARLAEDVGTLVDEVVNECAEAAHGSSVDQASELVRHALTLRSYVSDVVVCAVENARRAGMKWKDVGDLLGVSRQAAHAQFTSGKGSRRG